MTTDTIGFIRNINEAMTENINGLVGYGVLSVGYSKYTFLKENLDFLNEVVKKEIKKIEILEKYQSAIEDFEKHTLYICFSYNYDEMKKSYIQFVYEIIDIYNRQEYVNGMNLYDYVKQIGVTEFEEVNSEILYKKFLKCMLEQKFIRIDDYNHYLNKFNDFSFESIELIY